MNIIEYLQQRAAPWVSAAVLAGGLVSAVLLFFLVRMDNNLQAMDNFSLDDTQFSEY